MRRRDAILQLVSQYYMESFTHPLSPLRKRFFSTYEVSLKQTNNTVEPVLATQHFYSYFKVYSYCYSLSLLVTQDGRILILQLYSE